MSELTNARSDIAAILNDGGIGAVSYLPERIVPPVALVDSASPYVTPGSTFGTFTVHWTITLIAAKATNEEMTVALDDCIEDALVAFANAKYSIEQVGKPYALSANNAQYVAADLSIYYNVRI